MDAHARQHAEVRGGAVFATVWSNARRIERRLTFADLAAAVASGAADLQRLGLTKGRVALLSKGTLDFYVAVVSLQAARLTPVLLNWLQPVETLASMMADAACVALGVGAPYHELGAQLAGSVRCVFALDGGDELRWTWTTEWRMPMAPLDARPDEAVEAAVFFTTGSTSRPKPVLHTKATLLWTAENFVFPTENMRTTLCFMPNFHVLMCFQNFMLPLVRGVGCSIHGADATDVITPQLLLNAVIALEPTTIDTVPFIMNEWSTLDSASLAPLTKCAAVRSGGAPLSAAVARRLVDAGIRVQTHYGQTEAPGMQLLTVPGASAEELAIFAPPWACVDIRLDGATDREGELLIGRCGGSSPGYLKDGVLVPGSSRTDSSGWHHTGDVFRRATSQNGTRGVEFASRVDDVILLSTGEMFNPLPIEASVENYARRHGIEFERLVVLGQGHPAPFLVVEAKDDDDDDDDEDEDGRALLTRLQPGVDAANAGQVEYARIKRGHAVVVSGKGKNKVTLPHSAKGSVIRPRAEVELRELLTQIADDALCDGVDWAALQRAAYEAGFGNDVDAYLDSKGTNADALAVFGVDSLGIRSLTNRALVEAEWISDNVKAWTVTCIAMGHWYTPIWLQDGASGVGALDAFYNAPVQGKYKAVSWGVQYFTTVAVFISSVFRDDGPTSSISALVFVCGYVDGVRDGTKRQVKLTRREPSLAVLIAFMKFVVFTVGAYAYDNGWKPNNVHYVGPSNIVWFLYSLLLYRLATWVCQFAPIPPKLVPYCRALAVLAAYGFLVLDNINRDTAQLVSKTPYLPNWFNALANIVFQPGAFILGSTIKGTVSGEDLEFWPRSRHPRGYVYTYLTTAKTAGEKFTECIFWNDGKLMLLYSPWLLGYFYGQRIIQSFKAKLARLSVKLGGGNVVAFYAVLVAFFLNWLLGTTYVTWLARGTPAPFAPHVNRIYPPADQPQWPPATPRWIWRPSPSSNRNGIIAWNPRWARVFYILFDFAANYAVGFCMLVACVAVPWRAARCGNAALGKYILMQCWPTVFFIWLLYIVSCLGTAGGSANPLVQVTQCILLVGYPFFFVYMIGPFFTAVVILIPKFVLWLVYDSLKDPAAVPDDVKRFFRSAPADVRAWFGHYLHEIRRDLAILRATLVSAGRLLNRFSLCSHDRHHPDDDPLLDAKKPLVNTRVSPADYGTVADAV